MVPGTQVAEGSKRTRQTVGSRSLPPAAAASCGGGGGRNLPRPSAPWYAFSPSLMSKSSSPLLDASLPLSDQSAESDSENSSSSSAAAKLGGAAAAGAPATRGSAPAVCWKWWTRTGVLLLLGDMVETRLAPAASAAAPPPRQSPIAGGTIGGPSRSALSCAGLSTQAICQQRP